MIRSNLPLPFLYRLRLKAGAAARRAMSPAVNYRDQRPVSVPGRSAALRPAARRVAGGDAAQFWLVFIKQYETFTDVLCASAKTGCDSRRESEYAQLRCWFVANYYRIASRVRPYLEAELGESAALPSIVDYAGQKRCLDAFEALFLAPTLRDVLKHDTGDLIPRVALISEAIYRCHAEWKSGQAD